MRDNAWFRPSPRVVGAVLFTTGGVLASTEPPWEDWTGLFITAFAAGLGLTIVGFILEAAHDAHSKDAAERLEKANAEAARLRGDLEAAGQIIDDAIAITKEVMRAAAVQHGLTAEERVTVYRLDADGLVAVHRWSGDHKYREMSEQTQAARYDYTFGIIGNVAQKNRRMKEDGAPPPENKSQYNKWHRRRGSGMRAKDVEGLNMKSRCYDVVPLTDDRDDVVGVVAIESTESKSEAVNRFGDEVERKGGTASALRALLTIQNPTQSRDVDGESV